VVGGLSFRVSFGLLPPGGYLLNIASPFPFTARAFASAHEGVLFRGALYQVLNVTSLNGLVQVVVIISANYIPPLFVDVLLIP
jgi:hypothetical protein